jgi:hypothetical protein
MTEWAPDCANYMRTLMDRKQPTSSETILRGRTDNRFLGSHIR